MGNGKDPDHWSSYLDLHCLQRQGISGFSITNIAKTCLYNFDLLKPHFYIVKLGFTVIYIFFLIFAQIGCGYSLEPPRRYVLSRNMKNIRIFYLKIFIFLVVKFSVYLKGVFS